MNDTTEEITDKICEMFQKKSPIERLKMGCSMYDTSRRLVIRAILENDPDISEVGLRQELFLKFYGDDFDLDAQQEILAHIEKTSSSQSGKPPSL